MVLLECFVLVPHPERSRLGCFSNKCKKVLIQHEDFLREAFLYGVLMSKCKETSKLLVRQNLPRQFRGDVTEQSNGEAVF